MNIPIKYDELLTQKNIEFIRWSNIGAPNAADIEIMEYARNNELIMLTYDLDFSAILACTHKLKPSVIQIRASVLHAEQAVEFIAAALFKHADDLKKGAILSIDINSARLRLLPL